MSASGPSKASGSGAGASASSCSERDRLIKEFVLITATDSKVANFFLENNDWKLQEAVPDFFNLAGQIVNEDKSGSGNLSGFLKQERWAKESQEAQVTNTFTFVTWNVDGLDDRNFGARTQNLLTILKEERPDVIFLQEMVDQSTTVVVSGLPDYQSFIQRRGGEQYYLVTLVKKETCKVLSNKDCAFEGSHMGRGMLSVEVRLADMKMWLHNTHLESTADFKEERVGQLKQLFDKLKEHEKTHNTIVAGDMNLRDSEVPMAGNFPKSAVDVWEACGKRDVCKYTWDTVRNTNCLSKGGGGGGRRGNFQPRLRFDRIYLNACKGNDEPVAAPKHFGLLGIAKVPGTQSYTSDHWGLQVYFTVNKNK